MKKNVSGQKVGVQMITASDGSAFTGSVTVEVTLDAGTQATGSVSSGACTHEGNGYHTYAPSQAETNGDLVAFTFHGTGAIPATVQIYTSFPQTADVASGVTVSSIANNAITAAAIATDAIDADALKTDAVTEIQSGLSTLDAAGIRTAVGLASANLDTQLSGINSKTTNLPSDPADESLVIAATDAIAALIGTPAGTSVSDDIAAVQADTDDIQTRLPTALTGAGNIKADAQVVSDKTGYALTADIRIKKNTAFSKFPFVMFDSADHITGKDSLTVTAERSLDGGAFASMANSPVEISAGAYYIDLATADTNADSIIYKFSATGADTTFISFATQTE